MMAAMAAGRFATGEAHAAAASPVGPVGRPVNRASGVHKRPGELAGHGRLKQRPVLACGAVVGILSSANLQRPAGRHVAIASLRTP